jgi:hypothetical protein
MTNFNNAVSPEDLMSDLAEKLIRDKQQGNAKSSDNLIKIQSMDEKAVSPLSIGAEETKVDFGREMAI